MNTSERKESQLMRKGIWAIAYVSWSTTEPRLDDPKYLAMREYGKIAAVVFLILTLVFHNIRQYFLVRLLPALCIYAIAFSLWGEVLRRFAFCGYDHDITPSQQFLFDIPNKQVYILPEEGEQALPIFDESGFLGAILYENNNMRLTGTANQLTIDRLLELFPNTENKKPKRYRHFTITFSAAINDIMSIWDELPERCRIRM